MACDESLVIRLRHELSAVPGIGERRMFGGVCFTLHGNMLCGVAGDEIMVRVGPDAYPTALERTHAREMDFTGRPMRGYVFVVAAGVRNTDSLREWIGMARGFVGTLPRKAAKVAKVAKRGTAGRAKGR